MDWVQEYGIESGWEHGGTAESRGFLNRGLDFSVCKCVMHKKSQQGVEGNVGCSRVAMGNGEVVMAAEKGENRFCHASEETRRADKEFQDLCLNLPVGVYSYAGLGGNFERFATSTVDMKALGRGYCHLLGIPQGYYMRVARVLGPNPYVSDYLKVLCLVGRSSMKRLRVQKVCDGFLHVTKDKSAKGLDDGAGRRFYSTLVAEVLANPNVRIGYSGAVILPRRVGPVVPGVPLLCFGEYTKHMVDLEASAIVKEVSAFVVERFGPAMLSRFEIKPVTSEVLLSGMQAVHTKKKQGAKRGYNGKLEVVRRSNWRASTVVGSKSACCSEVKPVVEQSVEVVSVEKSDARRTLEKKWEVENRVAIAKAELAEVKAMKDLELQRARDVDAEIRRNRTMVMKQTESNKVATEKAFASLRATGDVVGFCETVVSGVSEEGSVPGMTEGSSPGGSVPGCTISPDSSASMHEFRECQKKNLDLEAEVAKLKRQLEYGKLAAGEEAAFTVYSNGDVSESVRGEINKHVTDWYDVDERDDAYGQDRAHTLFVRKVTVPCADEFAYDLIGQ